MNMQNLTAFRNWLSVSTLNCKAAGVEVLLDDRKERPGVMFADMELIGIPHSIVIGERGIDSGVVEYKHRRGGENQKLRLMKLWQN